jgi:hypothetical protein
MIQTRRALSRLAVLALVMIASLSPAIAAAQEVELLPVDELLAAPESFNGAEVTLEGELVGDYGFRDNGVMWTQLNDDSYARAALVDGGPRTGSNIGVGVRMPSILGRDLDPAGGYRLEGPVVQLTGIWRYHDPDRGGESYLDVTSVAVIDEGRRIQEGPDWVVFALGIMLITATVMLWRRRRERAAAAE